MTHPVLNAVAVCVLLTACQQPDGKAAPAAATEAPVAAAQLEALKTQVVTLVTADEDCSLPEGMESQRTAQTIDLGGGDAAVLVVCSTGMADQWSRVYVSQGGAGPVHTPLPLYRYQGAEGWQTWESMSNMSWSPAEGFAGSTRLQATGCGEGATWRWRNGRLELATQWHMDCDAIGADGELPDPIQDFPTTPPTEQPAVIQPQV
ncbi:hypothetical protein [Brevundimonas sp. NIBR11]|uniref:hypothetical protein n=1 Tax=Brevundimonas sp. NIBR11 TaxID=3015999 RepID=UPI0022F12B6A|nr:hypothetical protein [Brevundimonas sp. NIBR11]WGM31237.1 hypothetical protein KKHFBJBL_01481 [Brevundimonas sp. NIBR11]